MLVKDTPNDLEKQLHSHMHTVICMYTVLTFITISESSESAKKYKLTIKTYLLNIKYNKSTILFVSLNYSIITPK